MNTLHQVFRLELKNIILELEEEEQEIIMQDDLPQTNFLGVKIQKLETKNNYSLPYYLAKALVQSGRAEWTKPRESHSGILNKLVNIFSSEQRSALLQKFENNSIGRLYQSLKELKDQNSQDEINKKINQEWRNIIKQRNKKMLSKYKVDGPKETKKRLDPFEERLFNEIHLLVEIYEQFLFNFDKEIP